MSPDRPDPARPAAPLTAEALRAAFDAREPLTVGLEEELMLLDPQTLELAPLGPAVMAELEGDERFKLELPASQIELVTSPCRDVPAAVDELAAARRTLLERAGGLCRPAGAGVHPFSAPEGELNDHPRYRRTAEQFGRLAHAQLVCALQVHVAVGGGERTLAVYNAMRSYLPELLALAAAAPFYAGRDSGLATVRPKLSELLTRQGVPPAIESWEAFADALRWGAQADVLPNASLWWFELRPHPGWGTLELRVADTQASVADAAAVAALAHALVAELADRYERGERQPAHAAWRIAENRWSAMRDGVEGTLADLDTGARRPTGERLLELIDAVEPRAGELGCAAELGRARELARRNGAMMQREVAAQGGAAGVAGWLAERFGDGL